MGTVKAKALMSLLYRSSPVQIRIPIYLTFLNGINLGISIEAMLILFLLTTDVVVWIATLSE
jgi:hypothetical protein